MNKIEQEFVKKGLVEMRQNGEWFVLSKENAKAFVKACKEASILILGVDGFYLMGEKIQPSMENSIDFTSSSYTKASKDNFAEAVDFLNGRSDSLYFEIVCSEDE